MTTDATFTHTSRRNGRAVTREFQVHTLEEVGAAARNLGKLTRAQLLGLVAVEDPICHDNISRDRTLSKWDIVWHLMGRRYASSTLAAYDAWSSAA